MSGKKNKVITFIFFITILIIWRPDYIHNDNSTSRALAVMSLVEQGQLHFDQYAHLTGDKSFINGHVYSDKAPLPVFIVYPVIKLIQIFGLYPDEVTSRLNLVLVAGGFLVSVLPLVLIMFFLYNHLEDRKSSYRNYWLVTLPIMSGFLWVYNFSFYSHILAGFFIILAYLFIERGKYLVAGIISGLAFLTEYPVVVIPGVWILLEVIKFRKIKPAFTFITGLIPVASLLLLYNYMQSGQILQLSYDYVSDDYAQMKENYGFGLPSLNAIWGMTFSTYRGLLFFAPLFFPVVLVAIYYFIRKKESLKNFITHPWFIPFVIYILLISAYFMWWGGWSFGPRHLIPIVLFIFFYEIKENHLKNFFSPFLIIGFIGLLFMLIVKSTVMYGFPSGLNPFTEVLFPAIKEGITNPMNLPTIIFGIKPTSSAILWLAIYLLAGLLISRNKSDYNFVSSTPDK
ncbi:MAG: hypothetical protein ACR2GN_11180 [Bacteroidia bacterium]